MSNVSEDLLRKLGELGVSLELDAVGGLVVTAAKGALSAALVGELSSSKADLVDFLRRGAAAPADGQAGIVPDPARRFEPFPLTDIQQAYWVGRSESLELGGVGCHYYQELESADLDVKRLESSFQALIAHHDMLRAHLTEAGQQRILPQVPPYRISIVNLRGAGPDAIAAGIETVRERMAYRCASPYRWPMYEVQACLLDGGRVRVHLSFDLMMIDAESLGMMIRDWGRLYINPGSLVSPKLSFRDYVIAREAAVGGKAYRRAEAYWTGRLEDLAPAPDLPRPRPENALRPAPSLLRDRRRSTLDPAAWERIKLFATRRGLTPTTVLCALFADVLALWSRSRRFTLNLTRCERQPLHYDIDALLGDFTSTILLAVDTTPPNFEARAKALMARLMQDMEHAALSGVEVLRRMNRARPGAAGTGAAMPIVLTSLLGHGETLSNVLFTENWMGVPVHGVTQTPQVSLDFLLYQNGGSLVSQWDYVPGAFAEGVIDGMFACYDDYLQRLAADEKYWTAAERPVIPADQLRRRQQINDTARPTADSLLHDGFLAHAAARPEAPALITSDRTMSYGELDRRSLALAHRLRGLGIAPGSHVAVVMTKGWEQIVAVVGILRSGAAYLPIGAALPPGRIAQLLHDGRAAALITQATLEAGAIWHSDVPRFSVDPEPPVGDMPPLPAIQAPADLAYTIFTSGSTGRPKGVMIAHQAAVNTIADVNDRFGIGPDDRCLALSELNFDLSVYDIFGLLGAGGAIVLPAAGTERDPGHWGDLVDRHRVTVWNTVPTLMKMLVEHSVGERRFDHLSLVMMSGDWIPVCLPDQVRAIAPSARVISLGGATETSIWSILYPIDAVDQSWTSIPYGQPMANFTFHVLDEQLDDCPDWVIGEICCGGYGLAMGYWMNETETANRFVRHPRSGERLYRTGDLGRYTPDGNIEILGRADFQVKIDGHRIELGEIESVLMRDPTVRDAVVTVSTSPAGERRLVGYVVPETSAAVDEWRARLAESLPHYMVPPLLVSLDQLPLTANGKVDRARLPALTPIPAPDPSDDLPSKDDDEIGIAVATAVAEVLDVPTVRLADRFSDLGCTSIHMVQLHRRLSERFRSTISIVEFFNHATVVSLVSALRHCPSKHPANDDRLHLKPVHRRGSGTPTTGR